MILFPTLVVDDFLDNPDYVLDLAENTEYHNPSHTNHPGVISKDKLYDLVTDDYFIFENQKKYTIQHFTLINFTQKVCYLSLIHI